MFVLKDSWFEKNNLNVVDYQTRVITECINSLNTQELPVVMGATPSAGKTVMSIYIANHYINQGLKVLVLTHGTTVIRNNYAGSMMSLKNDFKYQIFEAGNTIQDVDMLIALPQSIKKQDLSIFDILIIDEAHERYFASELQDIITKVKPSKQLLLTGTPSSFIKSEINYPIHIVSMQEAYQQGRINDMTVHLCSSAYDIRDTDFNTTNDISRRGNNKLNKKDTEATLDNLLGELKNKLTNVFDGKIGSTIHNIFNWSFAIKEMGKTLIAANSIEQAKYIKEYFNNQNINTLISTHEDDVDSEQIDLFKNNPEYKILVVVRRGVLGFDMPSLVNVIDMTASRNLDRIYQLMSRVVRKSNDVKMKHFIKMAVPNTEATYELVMTATLCLMSKEYISKYDGRNFGQFEIPVEPVRRDRINGDHDQDPHPRGRLSIRPINILGMPMVDFFDKVFHKDGKVLNTHSLARISNVIYELGILVDSIKPKGYWTYERCKEEALKYKTKAEFKKGSKIACQLSYRRGWINELCSHMVDSIKPMGYWTYERCKEEALRFKTRGDFYKGSVTAYGVCHKNDWINELCSHMVEVIKPNGYWTYETCKEEALKYKTKTEFKKGSVTAYETCCKNGWMDELCSHMIGIKSKGYWTYERCKEEALKFKTRNNFHKVPGNAYSVCLKNGWLDEFFPKK
jgi:superfamily II DNA or RNA helicase